MGDLLAGLIVALFGALLTVAIAFGTYLLKTDLDERRAIQSLISELHIRRALRPVTASMIPGAAGSDDFVRVSSSVVSMRREVRSTRDRVRQIPRVQRPLSEMTRACNLYLSRSSANPDSYAIYLGELRLSLTSSVRELARGRRGVVAHEPGTGTL